MHEHDHLPPRRAVAHGRAGFTLIELLVVITIIVVLLALLTPALDKAIYQAELAVCGAQQKSVAGGVISYASANRRSYPFREVVQTSDSGWQPFQLTNGEAQDDRPFLTGYFSLDAMVDPLVPEEIRLDEANTDADTAVISTVQMWYSWRFGGGHAGSFRLGQRFSWTDETEDPAKRHRFNVLVCDYDSMAADSKSWVYGTHPDQDGVMQAFVARNESEAAPGLGVFKFHWSRWQTNQTNRRGTIDRNFGLDDGSVRRLTDLEIPEEGEDRVVGVPISNGKAGWPDFRTYIPPAE